MKERLRGIVAHMPTVYTSDGEIDEEAMRANIRHLLERGIRAIYLMGSSGEFFNIAPAEYRRVVQLFADESSPDVLKIVGCGSPRMAETLATVRWLNEVAAIDAVLVVPPYFVPLNSKERVGCLRAIASACPDLGVVHYNTSYAPAVLFTPEDYACLLDIPNFWGTKQGALTHELWKTLKALTPELRHLTLDDWLLPSMKENGYGAFSLVTSFSPQFALRWFQACERAEWDVATHMDKEFAAFIAEVYMPLSRRGYSDIAVDKTLVDCFGILTAGDPRAPLLPVTQEDTRWAAEQIARKKYFQVIP